MTAVDSQLLDIECLLQGEVGDPTKRWEGLAPEELRQEIERYRNAIIAIGTQLTQLGKCYWNVTLSLPVVPS